MLCIQILPCGPHAINLCMVEIEGRIAGAGIGVYVQTANGEVPAGMNTIDCFEISIEAAEVSAAIDEIDDICGFSLIAPDK